MLAKLAFGKGGLDLRLPDNYRYQFLEARSAMPFPDVDTALSEALDHPIASPPLRELARGKKSAAISVCDITRPAPNRVVLPHVLERLGGMDVTILIATGLHRPATDAEIRE